MSKCPQIIEKDKGNNTNSLHYNFISIDFSVFFNVFKRPTVFAQKSVSHYFTFTFLTFTFLLLNIPKIFKKNDQLFSQLVVHFTHSSWHSKIFPELYFKRANILDTCLITLPLFTFPLLFSREETYYKKD